jgi:hypothetical protein
MMAQAPGLDRDGLHRLLRQATRALARRGLRRESGFGPDQETAILALALVALVAADSEIVNPKFIDLTIPLLATTPEQIEVLTDFAASAEAQALLRRIFGNDATVSFRKPNEHAPDAFSVPEPGAEPISPGDVDTRRDEPASVSRHRLSSLWPRLEEAWKWLRARLWPGMRRARLVRQALSAISSKFVLLLPDAGARSADAAGQRRVAVALSSWEERGTLRLDPPRTIEATIKRGGLFQPRWRPVRRESEYLFLIQGLGGLDLAQERLRRLFARLAVAGVPLAYYFYLSDPRQLREFSSSGDGTVRLVDLATVAERHPYSRLAIISTAHELFHPLTLRPLSWTGALRAWPKRSVLSPLPWENWTSIETALQNELQFAIASARPQGLLDMAMAFGAEVSQRDTPPMSEVRSIDVVSTTELRYVTDFTPPADEQLKLVAGLRAYLGERGFEWLAMCACYPELNLDLTVYLG